MGGVTRVQASVAQVSSGLECAFAARRRSWRVRRCAAASVISFPPA
ncbi:hypothetical protein ACLI4R_12680 [Natrialbaceae archaeon A-chndr2]